LHVTLKGATTFKARTTKGSWSLVTMTPYDWGSHGQNISFSGELIVDDIEVKMDCKKILHMVLNFSKVQRKVIEEPRKVDRLFCII
jgi:hypothetical protein